LQRERIGWEGECTARPVSARFSVKAHTEFSYSYFPWLSAIDGWVSDFHSTGGSFEIAPLVSRLLIRFQKLTYDDQYT
jgi:hypothetical protein